MKRFISCFAAILFCALGFSQLQEVWTENFPSSYHPTISKLNSGDLLVAGGHYALKYDTLGNLLWSEEFEGLIWYGLVGRTNNHVAIDDNDNIFVLTNHNSNSEPNDSLSTTVKTTKLSPSGYVIWSIEYQYNTDYSENIAYSIHHSNNDLYITGRSRDSIGSWDAFLIKYDTMDGIESWRTTYDDMNGDYDLGAMVLTDELGNIYVGGNSDSNSNFGNEYLLLKFDSSGALMWDVRYENSDIYSNYLTDMVLTTQNKLVLGGLFHATVCFSAEGEFLWDYLPPNNLASNEVWDRTYDIAPMNNGDVVLTGSYRSSEPPGWIDPDVDHRTIRLSGEGELIWQNQHNLETELNRELGYTLFIDENEDVFVGGKSTIDQSFGFNDNASLIKLSGETGDLIWDYIDYQDPDGDDFLRSIHVDPNGTIYVCGSNQTADGGQFFIKKYNEISVSIPENYKDTPDFIISPNPSSSDFFSIDSKLFKGAEVSIEVLTANGNSIYKKEYIIGEKNIEISNYTSGMYVVRIELDGSAFYRKLIIQ